MIETQTESPEPQMSERDIFVLEELAGEMTTDPFTGIETTLSESLNDLFPKFVEVVRVNMDFIATPSSKRDLTRLNTAHWNGILSGLEDYHITLSEVLAIEMRRRWLEREALKSLENESYYAGLGGTNPIDYEQGKRRSNH